MSKHFYNITGENRILPKVHPAGLEDIAAADPDLGRWLQVTFFSQSLHRNGLCTFSTSKRSFGYCLFIPRLKKGGEKGEPSDLTFFGTQKVETFFLTFFGSPTCL